MDDENNKIKRPSIVLISEYSGWSSLTEQMKREKTHLIFAYLSGFFTALIVIALIRGGGLF